jgi:MFS superfamily sulfate permease-like transporter
VRRDEFIIAATTAAAVVVVGVMQGIILAIVLSVIDHLRFSYHPRDTYEAPAPGGGRTSLPVTGAAAPLEAAPGLVVYRFAATLYYANANRFTEEVRAIIGLEPPPTWLCLDLEAVGDIDFSGGETLRDLQGEMTERGVRLVFAAPSDLVRQELDRYGILGLVGADAVFESIESAVAAFQTRPTAGDATAPA